MRVFRPSIAFPRRAAIGVARTAACLTILTAIACGREASRPSGPSEFATFVDTYLDQWAMRHPSIAAGNGIHQHDDRLEDFSPTGIQNEVKWLKDVQKRLAAFDTTGLTPDERVDRRILAGVVDGWLLDVDKIKNWKRNPMLYASAVSDGVHNLMTMESAPAEVRLARVESKLHKVSELLQYARENIQNPPLIFARRGAAMFEGTSGMLREDLPRAFAGVTDVALKTRVFALADTAALLIDDYVGELRKNVIPKATGDPAIGADYVHERYKAEELIDLDLDTLLAIGERELAAEQRQFEEAARRVDAKRDAMAVWRDVLRDHPPRGGLVAATQQTVDELTAFVKAKDLVRLPNDEHVVVAAAPAFDIGLASMHASPPLEETPVKSYFYVTDADSTWPAARQDAWLQRFNRASLAITAAHEAMPGHWVHSLFMRETPGKVRRIWIGLNPFPQPSSGQDGWAHYAEHLVVEQGFKQDDARYAMAQLSESMTRICRLIAGIRVHSHKWTVDEAAKFFETAAHVPGPAARQEAERVTYDPTNGGYFLGKRAVLKLRKDYQAAQGDKFSLREFHERVMRNGISPWWGQRALLLPGDRGVVVE